jgi:hypothetical protein
MALRRTRWIHDGADLIKPQPSDGATLPSITDPRPARRAVAHIHVHGGKVADQTAPRRPPVVHGGQPNRGPPGFLGPSVDLRGRDQRGRDWGDRIYRLRGEGYEEDQDPDQLIA